MIVINGKTYEGHNLVIKGNQVFIDGKLIDDTSPNEKGILQVHVIGVASSIKSDGDVTITGDVFGNVEAGGSLRCDGHIEGNINCGGSVQCKNVNGKVIAGGSVQASSISSVKM